MDCDPSAAETASPAVKLAAVLAAAGGLLTLLLALGLGAADPLLLLAVPVVGGLGACQLWVAKGLWYRETWAWGWGVIIFGASALVGGVRYALGAEQALLSAVLPALLAVFVYRRHEAFDV